MPLTDLSRPDRPRVSRETRLLLGTAVLAVLALWILARVRFPDQPPVTTPLQPLLTQIGTRAAFDDLAAELADLRPRLESLFAGEALRIRPEVAVLPFGGDVRDLAPPDAIAADPLSRLAVIRVPAAATPPLLPWRPADVQQPRYLIAAARPAGTLVLEPILAGPLAPVSSPLWRELWRLPDGAEVRAGAFVFTTDARLAGLVVNLPDGRALVPAAVLLEELDRLLASGPRAPGYVGVEVQALTPALARATGASTGVVVTWVDQDGPAAAILTVGDVVEAIDEEPLLTPQQWTTWTEALPAGRTLMARVRRGDITRTAGLIAAPTRALRGAAVLGLQLRGLPRSGSAVVDVEPGSAAARAGLREGDVITLAGDATAPSPAAVRRAFERTPSGAAVLVGFTRGDTHAVTVLEKP